MIGKLYCPSKKCSQDVIAGSSTQQRWMERKPCGRWMAAWFQPNGTFWSILKLMFALMQSSHFSAWMHQLFLLHDRPSGIAGSIVWQMTPLPHIRQTPRSSWLRSTSSTWVAPRSSTYPTPPPGRRSMSGFHPKLELSRVWPPICKLWYPATLSLVCPE